MTDKHISRRSLLKMTAGAATAWTGTNWVFRATSDGRIVKAQTHGHEAGAAPAEFKPVFLTGAEVDQIAALCETIIPKTDTPGARDARVHEYIDVAMSVESEPIQKRFRDGLAWIEQYCQKQTKKGLAQASADQLITLLTPLSDKNATVADELKPGASFFTDLKSRTIFGFYTSREGFVEDLGRPEHIGMERWIGCPHPEGTHS